MNIENVEEVLEWLEGAFGNFSFHTFETDEVTIVDVEIYDDTIGDWEVKPMYFNKQGILMPKYREGIINQIASLQEEIEKLQNKLEILQKSREV